MSEIRIAIPDLDLNNALRLDGNLRNYEIGPFDDVVLDFSRMTNFDPLPMLMAGAIIKRFRYQYHDNTFSISGINGKSYAGTMGFFKYLSESISVGKSPGEATGSSNYIPITPISIRSLQERAFRDGGSIEIGDMIERASARLSRVIDRGNKELHIRNFLTHLLTTTRAFLFQKISLEDRGLFYLVCQNNAKLEHLERIVKEKFQMQDQNVQQIVEQLSMAIQKSETEERIKAKMASWNSRQIKNLGNRYTPDLNIPVEIMDSLHGASVDQQFQNIFYDKVDKFLIAMRHTELSEINALCDAIEKYAIELNFFNITSSDIDVIISTVNAIKDFLTSKIEEYYENPEGKKNFDSKAYQLYEKLGIANEFNDYLTNTTVRVAVSPYIILAGDGGVGKSHLIADYIDNCDSLGQTSLLLLGQQFSAGMDVLAILPTLLGCDITYHELFDIFEAIACTQKSRVLICIDALNEGAGVTFWNSVLGGLVDFLKEFPHIGLLVSVRTQYEDSLFDGQDTLRAQMQRIEHFGFTTVEHDAMHQYFSFYGITIDPVVFPISEFRNPLFLRLFCTANRNTHISLGDISLPFVYSQYISVDIFVREAHIDSLVRKVGFTTQGNTHVFCLLFERR